MKRTLIKVCGIRSAEALEAALDCGVDAVGWVFAESPRRIAPAEAALLAAACPPTVLRVGVFRHPSADEVAEVLARVPLSALQSDAQDEETIAMVAGPGGGEEAGAGAGFVPVFRDGADLAQRLAREREAGGGRMVLIEGPRSGAGEVVDWARVAGASAGLRVMLAGGLHAGNVAEAIARVRPFAVDVSSGVESSPGVKDPEKIAAFVDAVRGAER
jgi:phosphoribosylanthranilate isomerase